MMPLQQVRHKMNNETIQNIMAFLNRVDLKGAEVGAYMAAMTELSEMAKENEEKEEDREQLSLVM
jgi:hypothetical protein